MGEGQKLEASAREAAFARLRAFSDKLIGRDETLGALVRAACGQRLMVVQGPAGVGKSALLRAAAARLAEAGAFPAGVYWVSLRGATSLKIAREAILRALPTEPEACLAVLDGAEGLSLALLTEDLLAQCSLLHVLASTRTPHGLTPESTLVLAPLTPSDTRRLLVGWAGQDLDPEESMALSRLLDGNPHTARLVATLLQTERLSALRAQLETQLLARALAGEEDDLPLGVARDLLLQRLPEAPRRLLGSVSLFASGATAEDLEAVCGTGWQESVKGLQRAGLLNVDEDRFQVAVDLPETPPQAALGPTGVLLALALGHLRAGNVNAAFDLGERALTGARLSQNREGFAQALLVLGRVTLQEDPARAVLLFEEAATHFESLGGTALQAEARCWEGGALNQIGEPEAALAALYESHQQAPRPALEQLFTAVQHLFTERGGGSLFAALALEAATLRESGLLAARIRLGLPGK